MLVEEFGASEESRCRHSKEMKYIALSRDFVHSSMTKLGRTSGVKYAG
jgi:hypothetical protein